MRGGLHIGGNETRVHGGGAAAASVLTEQGTPAPRKRVRGRGRARRSLGPAGLSVGGDGVHVLYRGQRSPLPAVRASLSLLCHRHATVAICNTLTAGLTAGLWEALYRAGVIRGTAMTRHGGH